MYVLSHSVMSYSATPWAVACQSPLCMEFSGQEYWSGLPFPPPGNLPDPGIKPKSLVSPALVGDSLPLGKPQMYLLTISYYVFLHLSISNCHYLLQPIVISYLDD